MPIRPEPIAFSCPACGWSKTVAPRSDALKPGEYFDKCPVCGHEELSMQSKTITKMTTLPGLLFRIFKS